MELQMRMDPSWRKLRSYSGMANTWRKHTLQSLTLDGRPSSLDIHGLPITIWKLTGLTRVSPCLDALLSVEGSVDREKLRAVLLINPTKSTPLLILNQGEVGPKTQGRPLVSGSTGNRYFFNLLQSNFPASHLALNCLNQTR